MSPPIIQPRLLAVNVGAEQHGRVPRTCFRRQVPRRPTMHGLVGDTENTVGTATLRNVPARGGIHKRACHHVESTRLCTILAAWARSNNAITPAKNVYHQSL